MRLNWLVNPDTNLQEKMRYFADNFLFTNEYLGAIPNIPFDNPASLVNKIICQLKNNIERAPRYFVNHYQQLEEYYGDFLRKNYPQFLLVEKFFALYSKHPVGEKKKVAWLKAHPEFTISLQELETILEKDLFQKIFLLLTEYLQCRHKLNRHKKDIESCTQILVSLFRSKGHSKKQVAGYIDRILSTNRYQFPFPLEIYNHNKDESFDQITQEFLNNRDFQKQIEGLRNLMINHENRTGYFLYAINHVVIDKKLKDSFKVQIDNVTFLSPAHKTLKALRRSVRKVDKESYFKMYPLFFSKNKLLAYVNTRFEDKDYTRHHALKIVREELVLLNEYVNAKMELNDESYLFFEEMGSEHWSGSGNLAKFKLEHINGIKLDWLKQNPFELLRTHRFEGKGQFLHNEKTFIKGIQEGNISLLWQYIENLFWFQNAENEDIRKKIVTLLLKNRNRFTEHLLLSIGHLFFGLQRSKYCGEISDNNEVLDKISSELGYQHNTKFPIAKYKPFIKHNFLRSVIALYVNIKSQGSQIKWHKHFSSLVLELQEFRNAELHSGQGNNYSRIKLNDLIPLTINQVRLSFIDAAVKNKKLSFNKLVEKMTA